MRVIVAGSRSFTDYKLLKHKLSWLFTLIAPTVEIVSGGAKGADQLGERYAKEKGYPVKRFLPDWEKHGRKAGILRNVEMGDYADALVAFWDGESKGTEHMINYARKKGLAVRVIKYVNE